MNSNSNAGKFRFWHALAASLTLHALLLAQSLPLPHFSAAAPPLVATLRQLSQVATGDPREKPAEQQAEAPARAGASSAQQAKALAVPAVSAAEPALPRSGMTPSTAPSGEPGFAPAPRTTAPPEFALAAPPGLDSDSLRLYRFSLASAARRFKRYPALAIERGQSGRAEVRLGIAANGNSATPEITASSGSSVLDQAAVDMVARAAQATSVPARLHGAAFAVTLPVEFDLNEQ